MGYTFRNISVIEYGTSDGLPKDSQFNFVEGTKSRNVNTDEKHRWDGSAWIPGWDSGGSGGGGGVPEPTADGKWVRKKAGAAHTWELESSGSGLSLGVTSSDAYRGDRGKLAYDHSIKVTGNPHKVKYADLSDKPNLTQLHTHTNKALLDAIDQSMENKWNSAYTHSQATHAPTNAQKNVQSDWHITVASSDAFIKNKPPIILEPITEGIFGRKRAGTVNSWVKVISSEGSPTPIEKIWVGTQAQYSAITTKDPNTIYNIEENGVSSGCVLNPTADGNWYRKKAGSVYTWEDLDAPRSQYTLKGGAPKMIMEVDSPGGIAANMEVKYGTRVVASMQWDKTNQEFGFNLFDKDTGASKASFQIKPDGKAYIGNDEVATEKMIREFRTTVTHDIADHAKPTKAECITTFKLLPHYDWLKDDDYYIKDTSGGKIVLIKYRTKTGATEADPGNFFYEVLTKAV